jgi:hypothetical protein
MSDRRRRLPAASRRATARANAATVAAHRQASSPERTPPRRAFCCQEAIPSQHVKVWQRKTKPRSAEGSDQLQQFVPRHCNSTIPKSRPSWNITPGSQPATAAAEKAPKGRRILDFREKCNTEPRPGLTVILHARSVTFSARRNRLTDSAPKPPQLYYCFRYCTSLSMPTIHRGAAEQPQINLEVVPMNRSCLVSAFVVLMLAAGCASKDAPDDDRGRSDVGASCSVGQSGFVEHSASVRPENGASSDYRAVRRRSPRQSRMDDPPAPRSRTAPPNVMSQIGVA